MKKARKSKWMLGHTAEQTPLVRLLVNLATNLIGNKSFVKFIILGRSRVGSSLLVSFLNSHPNIRAEGELFQVIGYRNPDDVFKQIWHKQFTRHTCGRIQTFLLPSLRFTG